MEAPTIFLGILGEIAESTHTEKTKKNGKTKRRMKDN